MNRHQRTKNMKKILIVEDDQNIAKALSIRLKNAGYEVNVAPDALTGVENAVKKAPDLVLLDIWLPAGNGFTVAERIQSLIPTATPLIFLTASKKPGLREKAKELGAAAFFQKPYEWEDLLGAIQLALAGAPVVEELPIYVLRGPPPRIPRGSLRAYQI
jgi:two-component system alkaline phosphatase synthesis response regulator PhoP